MHTQDLHNDDAIGDEDTGPIIVTCARCDTMHPGFAPTQAYGCSADVVDAYGTKGIYGHYGSAVADMTFFAFTPTMPQEPALDLNDSVCDACLTVLIEAGHLSEQPYPMHPAFDPNGDGSDDDEQDEPE